MTTSLPPKTTPNRGSGNAPESTESLAAESVATETPTSPSRDRELSPLELAIWNDPAFQRDFAQSYIAETEIEPRVTEDERETMQEVLERIASDELDDAAELLLEEDDEAASAVLDYTLANIRFQQDRFDEALAHYRVAVEKYPKFRRAWRMMGQILARDGAYDEALPALTRVVELGGGDARTYGLLGYAHFQDERYLAAESAYRMAILLAPGSINWKTGLAFSLYKQERYADTIAICEQLIDEEPERADLWLLQGESYARTEEFLQAAENFELVDGLGKSTAGSLTTLGDIYANEKLFDLAVERYLRALEMSPDGNPSAMLNAARFLIGQSALEESELLLDGIAQMGANWSDAHDKELLRLRARLAVARGETGEEARVLEEIVALDPLDGEALILLGKHAERTEDPEKAIFYFERAAALEDHEADAKTAHGQLLVGQGKYTEALPYLRRGQDLKPRAALQDYLEQVEKLAKNR